jgi:hypothetical protein
MLVVLTARCLSLGGEEKHTQGAQQGERGVPHHGKKTGGAATERGIYSPLVYQPATAATCGVSPIATQDQMSYTITASEQKDTKSL